jgi:purine-binding chemotaxis protein CheW
MPLVSQDTIEKEAVEQFCTFRIAGYLYGVNIKNVKEINHEIQISRVPHAPTYIRGLVNIRGEIYLIFDLRECFGFPPEPVSPSHRTILFKGVEELSGILVDQMEDVIKVPSRKIESYHSDTVIEGMEPMQKQGNSFIGNQLVKDVYQMPGEIMIILHIQALLNLEEK